MCLTKENILVFDIYVQNVIIKWLCKHHGVNSNNRYFQFEVENEPTISN